MEQGSYEAAAKLVEQGSKFRCALDIEQVKQEFTRVLDEVMKTMDASEGELGNFNAKCQEMFQTALDARGDEEAKIVKLKAQAKDAFDAVKERFAIVPTDKTPQTLTIVCKRFYSTLVDKHLNAAYYEPADEEALAEAMATFKEASPGKQTNRVAQYVYLTMKMHKDDQANPHKAYVRMVAGTSSGHPKNPALNYTTAASAELAAALRGVLSSIKHLDILKCRGNSDHRDERYEELWLYNRRTKFALSSRAKKNADHRPTPTVESQRRTSQRCTPVLSSRPW